MGSCARESNGFRCYIFSGFPHASADAMHTIVGKIDEDRITEGNFQSRSCGRSRYCSVRAKNFSAATLRNSGDRGAEVGSGRRSEGRDRRRLSALHGVDSSARPHGMGGPSAISASPKCWDVRRSLRCPVKSERLRQKHRHLATCQRRIRTVLWRTGAASRGNS